MQAHGLARFSRYRLTGLAAVIALAIGILVGGQIDITGTRSGASPAHHASGVPTTVAETMPLFLTGDSDSVYQQQAAAVAGLCASSDAPLFIGGDIDGLANTSTNALISTGHCAVVQR